ncbi:MAG: hypothetical protein A3F18_02785 [Legionellales bacterium RIFCSPHIGHO2_12_FULL_37_14]|nr:MAG: hypothetical protein A3F18_02785 [Legionellales bacterium RIFCSPHIGHO2_12_FULL_37_14]
MILPSVFSVNSFEEAVTVELAQNHSSFFDMMAIVIIKSCLMFTNWVLNLLKRGCFSSATHVPSHVVIYTCGTLGDNILMIPAVAAVRACYAEANITLIAFCGAFTSTLQQIWKQTSYVNNLVCLTKESVQRHGVRICIDKDKLIDIKCDLFINLSPLGNRGCLGQVIREMLLARFLGARQAIGFRLNSYNRKNRFNRVQHLFMQNEARRPRMVLQELDISPIENIDLLSHDGAVKMAVEKILREVGVVVGNGPMILLNPGSKLAASRWPAERFGELAKWLVETYSAQVLINGVESEKDICDEVVHTSGDLAKSLAGKLSVQELIELLRLCDACISNNTGTMTLAAMLKIPLIVISSTRFSPTFYMPISDKMIWLFSFSKTSYSYHDGDDVSEDLLPIGVRDVTTAYEQLIREC